MIKKIKKHKNKLFILMLTLISALTLFLNVGKTYAYETDEFSYTINLYEDNTYNNEIVTQDIIVNNNTYNGYVITQTWNKTLYFRAKDLNIYTNNKYYIMINYLYLNNSNVIIQDNSSNAFNVVIGNGNYTTFYYTRRSYELHDYYTSVYQYLLGLTSNNSNNGFISIDLNDSNHKFVILNIDIVPVQDIGLSQYYDTYYGQIEDNYNTLLNNYNDLQDNYTTLEGNYNDLQDNYDDLEDNYNELQENYDALEDKTNYGIFGYLLDANFQYKIQDTPFVTINDKTSFNLTELQNLGIVTSGGNYNGTYFETNYNPDYEAVIANFYFNNSLPLTLIDLTFNDFEGALIEIVDLNGGIARFNINSNIQTINYTNILENYNTFGNFVDEIHITPNNAEIMGTMYTSSSYNVGYLYGTHNGFQIGVNSQQGTINDLNSQISSLNSQIVDLQNTISLVQTSNEQLRNELNVINANNMTWQRMFFTMADTPLKTVSSVLGKDVGNAFLGINLYDAFIGLVTTLAIIWLIKRLL